MIAASTQATSAPRRLVMLDESDLDWISEAISILERSQGMPWRVALDALDAMTEPRRKLTAVRGALARLTGGAAKLAPIARRVRAMLLGEPALDSDVRAARIAAVAAQVGVDEREIETLLFADLRGERTIALPHGRPSELEVAAFANIFLIQRALRRAHRVVLVLHDDDGTMLRAAMSRGLLVTASMSRGATVLEVVGPLALFQRTAVYGSTLAQLVPLLSSSARFAVEIESPGDRVQFESPVLLPLAPIDKRATYKPMKLARALARLDPTLNIALGPQPLRSGQSIACPDLAIDRGNERWYIEIVGFWTAAHIEHKLATYAAAGAERVFLCVDAERGCSDEPFELAAQPSTYVVQYSRHVDAAAIYATLTGRATC